MNRKEIKRLDILWSLKVKELAGRKCQFCKAEGKRLESAHVVGRKYRATRWDLANGMCLCFTCHQDYDQHGPLEQHIISRVVGEDEKRSLQVKAKHSIAKYQDYEDIKETLK